MRIGLFGGSFNPVHTQHLNIAEAVRASARLDQVWLLPVFQPVHKQETDLAPFEERLELLEAAVAGRPGLVCSDLERRLGGPSFTIRLVRQARRLFPGDTFFLVIGSDSLRDLPSWKSAADLIGELPFLVVARPGVSAVTALPNPESRWIPVEPHPASSSRIRAALRRGRCRGLPVPPGVMARIVAGDRYGCLGPTYRAWLAAVRARHEGLPKGMVAHLRGVALLTAEFAAAFGEDPRQGFLAGMAHDLFRLAGEAEVARWSTGGGRSPNALERRIPMLGHGLAAAGFLGSLRPRVPAQVLAAVRSHTFPRLGLAPLTKALIMGDALDPTRGKAELDALRNADQPLEEKFRRVVSRKQEKARGKQQKVVGTLAATASLPIPHE